MEISLFSKCIKELISENDRVDVPYLGSFTAEMMPAAYSDRQTTIDPPYRKMSFHKCDVSLEDGRMLLDKVVEKAGVTLEQAGVELGWCLSRLSSELEGSKICKLPGLGVMRANARNEFFFVPDDDLDIWPDGLGLEPVSIKVGHDTKEAKTPAQPKPEPAQPAPKEPKEIPGWTHGEPIKKERPSVLPRILTVIFILLVLFIIACYVFTEELSPIIDRILYTREELRLMGK